MAQKSLVFAVGKFIVSDYQLVCLVSLKEDVQLTQYPDLCGRNINHCFTGLVSWFIQQYECGQPKSIPLVNTGIKTKAIFLINLFGF